MISTTISGEPVYLMTHAPSWSSPVRMTVKVPSVRERGLTGRELRRPTSESITVASMRWTSVLNPDGLSKLKNATDGIRYERVFVPVWPLARSGSNWAASNVSSLYLIGWKRGFTSFSIASSLTAANWDFVAPGIYAFLEDIRPKAISPEIVEVDITVSEDGLDTEGIVPAVQSWEVGPALDDGTIPTVFPWRANWSKAPSSAHSSVERFTWEMGGHRRKALAIYPQNAEQQITANLRLVESDVGKFLRWFQDRQGSVGAHYVSGLTSPTRLASVANSGSSTLALASGPAVGASRFFSLLSPPTHRIVRAASISGNTANLTAPLDLTWSPGTTTLSLALLARHRDQEAELQFEAPWLCTVSQGWRELSAEYLPGAGEVRATTIGSQSTRASLFVLTVDWGGVTEVHRWTSHGRNITIGSDTWIATPVEYSEIRRTLRLDREELTLRSRWAAGGPFRIFMPGALDARLLLQISECVVSGGTGSSETVIFTGEITSAKFDGAVVEASASGASGLFDRVAPRFLVQPGCNYSLFQAGACGLVRADWTFTATAVSGSGTSITLGSFSVPSGPDASWGFANYFALGYLERTVSGKPRRHIIIASTAKAAGEVTFTLRTPLDSVLGGSESVSVVPGCDGSMKSCKAYNGTTNPTGKFNNFVRFGGVPGVPNRNPAFATPKQSASQNGKK